MTLREDRDHTVKDFLMRPVVVSQGEWSTTQTPGFQLYTTNFPEALLANDMYAQKLSGFMGLNATLVVRVQVNTQPFQQGRLMLQYIPYAQYLGPERVEMINSTLSGRSGCPRVDLDISVGTEVELRIPYVSPHMYYNLVTGQGSFGTIYLIVYGQLYDEVSGTGTVEYTVWAHLEDVEVEFPTGAPLYLGNSPNVIYAQIMPEIGRLKQSGVISSTLGTISEGLSTFSQLPVIGKFLETPSWLASTASNIAQLFGFSKPTIQAPICEAKFRPQTRMANYNGVDSSHKMALSANNEIEIKEGLAGTSLDDMALSTVVSIPNYWTTFTWTTDQLASTTLWSDFVTPFKTFTTGVENVFSTTHLGYIANCHSYWRGSLVYTFKFVKTAFHTGRVMIYFSPGSFSQYGPTPYTIDYNKCYRTIVDLRDSTEVSFTVPYVSTRPWLSCTYPGAPWLQQEGEDFPSLLYNCCSGVVGVRVLNKLVAGHNVRQAVDVIVEISGGPDMTFAGPTNPSLVPYHAPETIYAQIMGENVALQRNDAQTGVFPESLANAPIKANWSPEALCIGEKINSIRQLVKRFSPFATLLLTPEAPDVLMAPTACIMPTGLPSFPDVYSMSMYEYFFYLYAFWRGSMRIKASYNYSGTANTLPTRFEGLVQAVMYSAPNETMDSVLTKFRPVAAYGGETGDSNVAQSTFIDTADYFGGQSWHTLDPAIEGMVEVEIPYYNDAHITPTVPILPTQKPASLPQMYKGLVGTNILALISRGLPLTDRTTDVRLFRAPGDDFSFLYVLGVPRLAPVPRSNPIPPPPSDGLTSYVDDIYSTD